MSGMARGPERRPLEAKGTAVRVRLWVLSGPRSSGPLATPCGRFTSIRDFSACNKLFSVTKMASSLPRALRPSSDAYGPTAYATRHLPPVTPRRTHTRSPTARGVMGVCVGDELVLLGGELAVLQGGELAALGLLAVS